MAALDNLAAIQMVDVHLPTTDGRHLILSRYTQPEPEQQILLDQLRLDLPPQPPPRISVASDTHRAQACLYADLYRCAYRASRGYVAQGSEQRKSGYAGCRLRFL
jgi:hypothetical protein